MREPLSREKRRRIMEELAAREQHSLKQIARRYNVSRTTLWRLREEVIGGFAQDEALKPR